MGKLQSTALYIQKRLLVLAHAEYLFVGIGFKPRGDLIFAAQDGLEFAGAYLKGAGKFPGDVLAVAHIFLQKQLALRIEKGQLSPGGHARLDAAVSDPGHFTVNRDFRRRFGGQKRPVPLRHFAHPGGAHAQRILSPGLYPDFFRTENGYKPVSILSEHTVLHLFQAPRAHARRRHNLPIQFPSRSRELLPRRPSP